MSDKTRADFEQWLKDSAIAMPEIQTVVSSDISTGLSKREHIAALCLQGVLANEAYIYDAHNRVKIAVKNADKLLAELEKGGEE